MEETKKSFTEINRYYKITSKELKKALGIQGEIITINLQRGRSPNDEAKGVSPDTDLWEIKTIERQKQ